MATASQWVLIIFGVLSLLASLGAAGERNIGFAAGTGLFALLMFLIAAYIPTINRQAAERSAAAAEAAQIETARRAYESAPKCPFCGSPNDWGTREQGRTVVSQTRGFGMVDRVETHTGIYGDPTRTKQIRRQERVPMISTVTRVEYRCSACSRSTFSDFTTTVEDFSRDSPSSTRPSGGPVTINIPAAPPPQIKRRCRYCGSAYDEGRGACPSCGAAF